VWASNFRGKPCFRGPRKADKLELYRKQSGISSRNEPVTTSFLSPSDSSFSIPTFSSRRALPSSSRTVRHLRTPCSSFAKNRPLGIVSAPLWDSHTSTFAGLLTTSDYINVVQYYWQNPDALSQIDQFRLSSLRGRTVHNV
jgi:hypothetical protein